MNTDSQEPKTLTTRQLIAFFALIVGMFMAILDIQIVASSLSEIAAGLSASGDELSWIQTAYLIAEVIIIPITGFATKVLSTRIFYFIAALCFTIMSVLCSMAWNIESMIIFRALQGFFGGALIPTAFGAIMIIFPKELQAKASVAVGLIVTVAPTIGPTLGGYITETISWHFMFLLNVIPGIFVCITVLNYVDFDKPNHSLLKNFDYIGVILMTVSLGTLQYVLEEGTKKGWFDDRQIVVLTILIVASFVLLIKRELSFSNPVVDLYAFKNKNFAFGCIYSVIMGVGLYGSVYLLPLFLFTVAGYNTFQIGVAMIVTGLFQFVSAPIAGKMFESGIDKRFMLFIGFSLFGFGCYLNSFLTSDSADAELFLPQMVRGLALMFCFMPVNDLALGTLPKEEIQNASGLYNLTRNLGGAIGLALINNFITSASSEFAYALKVNMSEHSAGLIQNISIYLDNFLPPSMDPNLIGQVYVSNIVAREAFVIAINNVFVIIAVMFFLGLLLLPFTTNIQHKVKNDH